MEKNDVVASHCWNCGSQTQHKVEASLTRDSVFRTENDEADCILEYFLLICEHCNAPQIRGARWIPQDMCYVEWYIPPHPKRVYPDWGNELPKHIGSLLAETQNALTNNYLWLAAMGTRSLIDMFALQRVGDVGGFAQKLKRLENEGFISTKDRLVLELALEVGHEATHRVRQPSLHECQGALEITENLLHRLILDERANVIRESLSIKKKDHLKL